MVKHVGRRGDTLIEVMLAVGIFSMVAVAVVAVMSGGTSSSQTALETTLAREEIDNQAEALRFIHRAYISDKNTGENSRFGELWLDVTNLAVNNDGTDPDTALTQFHPSSCQDLYDTSIDGEAIDHGFIIDPTKFAAYEAGADTNQVLLRGDRTGDTGNASSNLFQPAATYPHLIYAARASASDTNDTDLLDHTADTTGSSNLYRAEGIYVIAVKDPSSTAITGADKLSAYYDFYIRTCWYGAGDQTPSTISTVIRLYNPDIAQ